MFYRLKIKKIVLTQILLQHRDFQSHRRQAKISKESNAHFFRNWPLNKRISTCLPKINVGQFSWKDIIQSCSFFILYAPRRLPIILNFQRFLQATLLSSFLCFLLHHFQVLFSEAELLFQVLHHLSPAGPCILMIMLSSDELKPQAESP